MSVKNPADPTDNSNMKTGSLEIQLQSWSRNYCWRTAAKVDIKTVPLQQKNLYASHQLLRCLVFSFLSKIFFKTVGDEEVKGFATSGGAEFGEEGLLDAELNPVTLGRLLRFNFAGRFAGKGAVHGMIDDVQNARVAQRKNVDRTNFWEFQELHSLHPGIQYKRAVKFARIFEYLGSASKDVNFTKFSAKNHKNVKTRFILLILRPYFNYQKPSLMNLNEKATFWGWRSNQAPRKCHVDEFRFSLFGF